jgi:predicted component of viral defense system (DUF524 family)
MTCPTPNLRFSVIGRYRHETSWYVLSRFKTHAEAQTYRDALLEHSAVVVHIGTEQVTLMMLRNDNDETISNYCPF